MSVSLIMTLASNGLKAQDSLNVISRWLNFSDAKNSLYHDLANQAYRQLDVRNDIISNIHSLSGWKLRQQWERSALADIVGTFPKKTPLNARITKTIKEDNYTIEDVIYESQPKFYITASLFIPDGLKKKAPAIIYCSGHSRPGYRSRIYQHVILNLVKKGFIVFAFDPIGQGERLEYYDPKTGKYVLGPSPTHEHSYPGAQLFITGSSLARYMIWDGIRAVDYLLTRKEVDPDRIGITGRSGGGTQSAYIAALDNQIYAAAPENYITSFKRLLQAIGPQDAEQNLFNEIARGIDHADLLEVRAPKPTLMITTTRDFFPIQGAIETAREVSRIYKAYGKSNNFRMVADNTVHASNKKNRESMYAFFQKYLDNPGDSTDLEVEPLRNGELLVTKTGQVSTSLGGETIFSLNRKYTEKLVRKLQTSRKDIPRHISGVLKAAKKLSGYHKPKVYHAPVFTGRFQKNGYVIGKYFVKGEGGYVIPYLLMIPDKPNGKAVICLNPAGKSIEAAAGGDMEWFVKRGFTVLCPDLIGLGEMGPGEYHGDSFIKNTSYGVWYLSTLIGRSIVGIRAGDVVRLTRLLKKNNHISRIYGLARGEIAPVLLHAAAFDTAISRVILIKPYCSYRSIVMNRLYKPSFVHGAVPGALKAYDLPDLAASLAPRKLMMIDITNGNDEPLAPGSDSTDLSIIKAAYHYRKAGNQLNILYDESPENLHGLFEKWIK
ncbi:MAG TPA: alpha/beta hydrolase family protein [Hanamia sp.]|nr:alpha/beta hydrolase family protein [Hanamia sp.]